MIKSFSLIIFLILQGNLFPQADYNPSKDSTGIVGDSLTGKSVHSTALDSMSLLTGIKKITERDTIVPIFQSPVSGNGVFLSRENLQKNDYRFTPDYLKLFEFSYQSETGNLGYPDHLFLYGLESFRTNYLKDGVSLNDNPVIFFDLNYLQSESVDSIEIIHAPRAFLFGNYNYSASINFISKDFISITPFTRIKYYQGAFGEAMLDGIFNSVLYKKLFAFVDITNRKLDKRYANSDFSSWQANVKLRYLLSNSFNIIGSYNYNKMYKGLNGGINIDTLNYLGYDINSYLYDEIRAPVINKITDMDVVQHNFNLRLLAKPFAGGNTDFTLYYKTDAQSLNNINDDHNDFAKTKNKLYGLNLNQKYHQDIYELNVIANYEHSDINLNSSQGLYLNQDLLKLNSFSFAGIADFNLTPEIKTSLFYKYSYLSNDLLSNSTTNKGSNGFGLDINFNASKEFSLYLGYSGFKDYYSEKYCSNVELASIFSPSNLFLKFSIFSRNNLENNPYPYLLLFNLQPYPALDYYSSNDAGIGINIKYNFWIMTFENISSYFNGGPGVPDYKSRSGLYISDSLFSSNLNLKGGFVFNYIGRIKYPSPSTLFAEIGPEINPSYTLDFTLAGRIRNAATVYFTWENLLDNKYYLIPWYPALGRNLRFGIAWDLFN
jgi:hypothetical protein